MTFPAAPCTRFKTLSLDLKRERTEGRKRKKFYIYLDVTHTHCLGSLAGVIMFYYIN
jgi:hypothetical protein